MIVIFDFSAQTRAQSQGISDGLLTNIISFLNPDFKDMTEQGKLLIIREFSIYLRKFAHFTSYLILEWCAVLALAPFFKKEKNLYIYSLLLCLLYAASDEIHQIFVSGRGAKFTDVLIDFCGSITGMLLLLLIKKIILDFKSKKKAN